MGDARDETLVSVQWGVLDRVGGTTLARQGSCWL